MARMHASIASFSPAPFEPDWPSLRCTLLRQGTPARVHFLELIIDDEIKDGVCRIFGLCRDIDPADPIGRLRREIELARFLGYDSFRLRTDFLVDFPRKKETSADAAGIASDYRRAQRQWTNEREGPIQTWQDLERYAWPDPARADLRVLEWLEKHVPDGMTVCASCHQMFEQTSWLMGLTSLCYALQDDEALVDEIGRRVGEAFLAAARIYAQFQCIGFFFGGDDLGFRGGTLLAPEVLRAKFLPYHRELTRIAHAAGKPNLLHSCGKIDAIMPDLIEVVGIDGKHSFDDTASPVLDANRRWGDRIAILGGIDVDFLCRASAAEIEARVRATLDACQAGGGYCLGSGNSIANYVPLENFLTMLAAGRRYGA